MSDMDKYKQALDLLTQANDLLGETDLETEENGMDILCSLGDVISDLYGILQ